MEKIRGASVYGQYLEEHLDYSDYVGEKEKVVGEWFGELRSEVGVDGPCHGSKDTGFRALCDGLHPLTGERLTPHVREDGIRFFDFQADTPKSVSVLAVTMGDRRLVEAHNASVRVGIRELERFAAYRAGTNAAQRAPEITGKIVGAAFTHLTARPDAGGGPADPQLHTHCAVANVTKAKDGKFYALTEIEMVRAIRYGGKAYENEMVRRIRSLGYEVTWRHGPRGNIEGFEIGGVSQAVMDRFSKRSAAVERAIDAFRAEHGRDPSGGELRVIKRDTRGEKALEMSAKAIVDAQRAQLNAEDLQQLEETVRSAQQRGAVTQSLNVEPTVALSAAAEHLFERESVLPRHAVLAEALAQNLGRVDLSALESAVGFDTRLPALTEAPETLAVKVSTDRGLSAELRAIETVGAGFGLCAPFVPVDRFRAFGGSDQAVMDGVTVNVAEQRSVADGVLASTDRFISLRGVAGAGKTTVLAEIHKGFVAGEWRPLYVAPTTAARDVLKSSGFLNASTLQQLLAEQKHPEMQLPPRTVLVVDEASLQSTALGLELMRVAENRGARVLFVGDTKQHVAVEAGDFLRILEEHSGIQQFTLDKIQRQRVEEYRLAMQEAARGDSRAAVERLDALGWVKEGKAEYLAKAAEELVALRLEHGPRNVIGVAPTHAEGEAMTSIVRRRLAAQGNLSDERIVRTFDSFDWTAQQRLNLENYRPGQRIAVMTGEVAGMPANAVAEILEVDRDAKTVLVRSEQGEHRVTIDRATVRRFQVGEGRELPVAAGDALLVTANDKKHRLVNGELLTVTAIAPDGTVTTREGKEIPPAFRHLAHGYVVTSHRSQGRTVDHVVVAADTLSAKAAYVSLSRGRVSAALHTAEKENLYRRLPERNTGRTAGLDLTGQPLLRSVVERAQARGVRLGYWRRATTAAHRIAHRARVGLRYAKRYAYQVMKGNAQRRSQNVRPR